MPMTLMFERWLTAVNMRDTTAANKLSCWFCTPAKVEGHKILPTTAKLCAKDRVDLLGKNFCLQTLNIKDWWFKTM